MVEAHGGDGRALRGIEAALAESAAHWPMNLVVALRLAPVPAEEHLRAALDAVQQRHPALRARIVGKGRRLRFVHGGAVPPIPLTISTGSWAAAVEAGLNTGFDDGPLARCVLVGGDGDAQLVLTIHHAIVDGIAAAALAAEIIEECAPSGEGIGASHDPAAGLPPPAPELFPSSAAGFRLACRRVWFVLRTLVPEFRFRWGIRRAGPPPVRTDGTVQVTTRSLDAAVTSRLGRRARDRRLTLHSVLQAALLMAVHRRRYGGARLAMRAVAFADLRPGSVPPVPPGRLACHLAMTWCDVAMEEGRDLWSLAPEVQEEIDASVRGSAKFVASSLARPLMRMAIRLGRLRLSNTALTFTGVSAIAGRHGPFDVSDVHGFVSVLGVGPEVSVHSAIVEGRLSLDAMTLAADMNRAAMDAIVDELRAILEDAAA